METTIGLGFRGLGFGVWGQGFEGFEGLGYSGWV